MFLEYSECYITGGIQGIQCVLKIQRILLWTTRNTMCSEDTKNTAVDYKEYNAFCIDTNNTALEYYEYYSSILGI